MPQRICRGWSFVCRHCGKKHIVPFEYTPGSIFVPCREQNLVSTYYHEEDFKFWHGPYSIYLANRVNPEFRLKS